MVANSNIIWDKRLTPAERNEVYRLAAHKTRVHLYKFTLVKPPPKYAHLKGITRIGQTAEHLGQGKKRALANRRRQYLQGRGNDIFKQLVEEIGWGCFSDMEVIETIEEPSMPIVTARCQKTVDNFPRMRAHRRGNILEAQLIAEKGTWRGFNVLNPTRQNLNDRQGGQGDEWKRIQSEVIGKRYQAAPCTHGRANRSVCKECGGSAICVHDRIRSTCKECGGSAICAHDRRRSLCKECGGGSICAHDRQRYRCKECGGSAICVHDKRRSECKECGGSAICVHDRIRSLCKECGGSAICAHDRRRSLCKECGGGSICAHDRQRYRCKECKKYKANTIVCEPCQ